MAANIAPHGEHLRNHSQNPTPPRLLAFPPKPHNLLPPIPAGMSEWKEEYPQFAKFGWGPSTKAEVRRETNTPLLSCTSRQCSHQDLYNIVTVI